MYLAPVNRLIILSCTALYALVRLAVNFVLGFGFGALVFRVNPLQGDIALALVFLMVGLVPLFGVSLLYGALVLRVKESRSLIQLAQWVVSFLMGVFYPVAVFPPLLRAVALLFPPTWMTNGVRASLLGVGYFFGSWYADLAVLAAFLVIAPLVGYQVFAAFERGMMKNEGVGQF